MHISPAQGGADGGANGYRQRLADLIYELLAAVASEVTTKVRMVAAPRQGQDVLGPLISPNLRNEVTFATRSKGPKNEAQRVVGHGVILSALPDIEARTTRDYGQGS